MTVFVKATVAALALALLPACSPGELVEGPKVQKSGERVAAVPMSTGSGVGAEVACPSSSCSALASGSHDILSCQDGKTLVRCQWGKPRCFACKPGTSCFFNNGGEGRDDFCSGSGGSAGCAACPAAASATGSIWACEESASRLVRCNGGCMETRKCAEGCTYNNGGTGHDDLCGRASSSGFIWPAGGTLTSYFTGAYAHDGIDIASSAGTPIVASAAGTVITAQYHSCWGNHIIIDHGGGSWTYYGHLGSFGVSVGQWVKQGAFVGAMGATGSCCTGPHTHFITTINGVKVDPLSVLP